MDNITFTIKNSSSQLNGGLDATIYVRYRLGRKVDFKASTGLKINSNDWDKQRQTLKNRSHLVNRRDILDVMESIRNHFTRFELDNLKNGFIPNYEEVKECFKSFYSKTEVKDLDLFGLINQFIEERRTAFKVREKQILYSKRTIQSYENTYNFLKEFNDNVYKIDFKNLSLKWYEDFMEFFYSKKYSLNYLGKQIKTLKSFLNYAITKGYEVNMDFKLKEFKVLKEESDTIALDVQELQRMFDLDLSENKRMERARDLFIVGAFTGLRVSDFNYLKQENIKVVDGVKMLVVETYKTNREIGVPLHWMVQKVLDKYEGVPKRIPDQEINEHIKVVGLKAMILDEVVWRRTIGGKTTEIKSKKYELISTHTARRSFVTNAHYSGISSLDIMSITGHATEKSFMAYLKQAPERTAIKMSESPFFSNDGG